MGFYHTEQGVDEYFKLAAEGSDGAEIIEWLSAYLPDPQSSVLELGMGPGKDFDVLKQKYKTTGSDFSQIFLDRYLQIHPNADVILLDAISLETPRKFDAIYTNKVLQHLTVQECRQSLAAQHGVLNPGGIAAHSLWYGNKYEEFEGLRFQQYTEESFALLFKEHFELLESKIYTEMEPNDSVVFFLKKNL